MHRVLPTRLLQSPTLPPQAPRPPDAAASPSLLLWPQQAPRPTTAATPSTDSASLPRQQGSASSRRYRSNHHALYFGLIGHLILSTQPPYAPSLPLYLRRNWYRVPPTRLQQSPSSLPRRHQARRPPDTVATGNESSNFPAATGTASSRRGRFKHRILYQYIYNRHRALLATRPLPTLNHLTHPPPAPCPPHTQLLQATSPPPRLQTPHPHPDAAASRTKSSIWPQQAPRPL